MNCYEQQTKKTGASVAIYVKDFSSVLAKTFGRQEKNLQSFQ
jgi:hypothetical protein